MTFSESNLGTGEERSVQKTIGPQAGGLRKAAEANMNCLVSLSSGQQSNNPQIIPSLSHRPVDSPHEFQVPCLFPSTNPTLSS